MKKKKVKHDKKWFPKESIVTFVHEKRLRSFLEFIPGNKGKKKGGEQNGSKDLKKKYEENKERIQSEFGFKKKIDMYMEQADREATEALSLKEKWDKKWEKKMKKHKKHKKWRRSSSNSSKKSE